MRISEVMTRGAACTCPDAMLTEAAGQMSALQIGFLPVCDGEKLVGMLTDRDITIRATANGRDPNQTRVREVMTPQVHYCYEDHLIVDAALLMQENHVRRLPVLDHNQRLVGVVSLGDLAVDGGEDQLAESTLEEVAERNQSRQA